MIKKINKKSSNLSTVEINGHSFGSGDLVKFDASSLAGKGRGEIMKIQGTPEKPLVIVTWGGEGSIEFLAIAYPELNTIRKASVEGGIYMKRSKQNNRILAVDKSTREYYEKYYGGYGEDLTRDVEDIVLRKEKREELKSPGWEGESGYKEKGKKTD